ncbi:Protein transport protein sft1 [Beauveria bassiana]|nr:Protein transport protein sft1 [Beauveria bassiana]KAH8719963.1 Protein transport protein sft1 [Beauveria bassiana]
MQPLFPTIYRPFFFHPKTPSTCSDPDVRPIDQRHKAQNLHHLFFLQPGCNHPSKQLSRRIGRPSPPPYYSLTPFHLGCETTSAPHRPRQLYTHVHTTATAAMSESYERERQNNSRLDELSAKVSALRGVTVDIYDNARAQDVIDNTSETFSSMTTQMRGSAGRLTRMAASGNKVAILKLSGILIGVFIFLYYAARVFF